jgi:hypothetical protein
MSTAQAFLLTVTEEAPMKKTLVLAALLTLSFTMNGALAADCVVHVKRTACSGQEKESYKKCDGAQECDVAEASATTDAACVKAAMAACDNSRVDVAKYKVVTSTYKGAALAGGFSTDGKSDPKGVNFCGADRADMNKCK